MEILSKKLDSSTRCVYSYQVLRVPGLSKPVEERVRIVTPYTIYSHGLTSVVDDGMAEESVLSTLGMAVANMWGCGGGLGDCRLASE